jgi:hypothetical protein
MNKKEFNTFIDEIAVQLTPLNQLLFQAFILIVFYYIFDTISHSQSHKSFIVLIAIICIILDLCIWNNITQTILFIAILTLYITYNINKDVAIDTFINTMNTIKTINNDNIKELWKKEELDRKNKDEIEKITFIPQHFNELKNNTTTNTSLEESPEPFDKAQKDINELNVAYKETKPTTRLTDSKYARTMLNILYETAQYKNIKKDNIDEALDNNIHYKDIDNNNSSSSDKKNIELFRKPKKQFLDDTWLKDTCKSNCINNALPNKVIEKEPKIRNKNAICTLVKFGYQLSECTNQENTITDTQLDTISSNNVVIVI